MTIYTLTLKSTSSTTVSLLLTAISSALGRSAGSITVAPRCLIVFSASSKATFTEGSFPVILSSRKTRRGTPIRAPASAFGFNARRKLGTTGGWASVKLSLGSGPAMTERTIAASETERVIGPTVSWCSEIGTT